MRPELEELLSLQLPPSNIRIATAITNQELEAKVISVAQVNNWQIIKRAFDVVDLDLSEINFLFLSGDQARPNFNGNLMILTGNETSEEISALIINPVDNSRTNFSLRTGTGKNFILRSISGGTGCTTLAINLAFEITDFDYKVHLIDFDTNPVIAPFLGLRDLLKNPVRLRSNLQVSQANFSDLDNYQRFVQTQVDNDFTSVFDVGTSSREFIPATNIYTSRIDLPSYCRLQNLINRHEIADGSWLILNQKYNSVHQKKLESQFVNLFDPLKIIWDRLLISNLYQFLFFF